MTVTKEEAKELGSMSVADVCMWLSGSRIWSSSCNSGTSILTAGSAADESRLTMVVHMDLSAVPEEAAFDFHIDLTNIKNTCINLRLYVNMKTNN